MPAGTYTLTAFVKSSGKQKLFISTNGKVSSCDLVSEATTNNPNGDTMTISVTLSEPASKLCFGVRDNRPKEYSEWRVDLKDFIISYDESTSIKSVNTSSETNNGLYNLQGHRVGDSSNVKSQTRGIYIVGGKKIFTK